MQTRNTDDDWNVLADENPYWAVMSSDKYKGKELSPEMRGEFFASGAALVEHDLNFIRTRVAPNFSPAVAVDFGCGVGRLSIPLSRVVPTVHSVDVAPAMLDLCAKNAAAVGITNIRLGESEAFVGGDVEFDWFYSRIVLQHIPPVVGLSILRKLLPRLRPRGVASFNVTFARDATHAGVISEHARYVRGLNDRVELLGIKSPAEVDAGRMSMYEYDVNELMLVLLENRIRSPVVQIYGGGGYYAVHIYGEKSE